MSRKELCAAWEYKVRPGRGEICIHRTLRTFWTDILNSLYRIQAASFLCLEHGVGRERRRQKERANAVESSFCPAFKYMILRPRSMPRCTPFFLPYYLLRMGAGRVARTRFSHPYTFPIPATAQQWNSSSRNLSMRHLYPLSLPSLFGLNTFDFIFGFRSSSHNFARNLIDLHLHFENILIPLMHASKCVLAEPRANSSTKTHVGLKSQITPSTNFRELW